jgi:hypothetical protein
MFTVIRSLSLGQRIVWFPSQSFQGVAYQDVPRLCRLVRHSDAVSSGAALPSVQNSCRSKSIWSRSYRYGLRLLFLKLTQCS